jgi:hypothetical protein
MTDHTPRFDLSRATVGALLDDPDARAIIDRLAPELPRHPMIGMARGIPFNTMVALSGGEFPPALADQLREELGRL